MSVALAIADFQCTLKGSLPVFADEEVHRVRPLTQPLLSLLHYRPANLSFIPFVHFLIPFFFSRVRRNRYDSSPVSMMCAWSVSRSSIALHNRAFGNIVVHSENGRFVVTITAAFSARPAIIWNIISAAASGIAT